MEDFMDYETFDPFADGLDDLMEFRDRELDADADAGEFEFDPGDDDHPGLEIEF